MKGYSEKNLSSRISHSCSHEIFQSKGQFRDFLKVDGAIN